MTQEEIEEFKRKARAYYGADEPLQEPGIGEPWRDIVRDYKEMATSRYRPPTDQLSPHANYRGMTVNPEAFSYGDPLGLLSSTEDMDEVLGNVDYRAKLDQLAPDRLQGPVKPPMEMRTDGIPVGGGQQGVFNPDEIIPYHAESFQNIINPLPFLNQLEGPDTATGPIISQMGHEGMKYDPNQELYDQNYYGTPGQMGQMGTPPPGIIPSSVTGRHPPRNQPFSVTGRSAMSGGEMPGLLESGGEIISQTLPPGQSTTEEDWQKQGWDTQSTGEGPKWEKTSEGEDSIFRRNRRLQGYKGIMDLGARIIGKPSKWK